MHEIEKHCFGEIRLRVADRDMTVPVSASDISQRRVTPCACSSLRLGLARSVRVGYMQGDGNVSGVPGDVRRTPSIARPSVVCVSNSDARPRLGGELDISQNFGQCQWILPSRHRDENATSVGQKGASGDFGMHAAT
jgi:hypothetical protein